MKYGVIAENITERLALMAGKVPIPLLDALYSIMKARALMAGVSLGVFEAMRKGSHSTKNLSRRLSLDEECLDLLLRLLVSAGYLTHQAKRYKLSRLGRRTMLRGSDMEMVSYIQWNYKQWEFMEGMEDLIRTGKGIDFHKRLKDSEAWAHYQRAMLEIARLDAATVASRVPVPEGAKRLLDLGGSHGWFGAALCRKYPPMRSVVIDLPQAIPHAKKLARLEGISDIVEHRAGDLLTANFGRDYEVALLANVLHHFGPDQIKEIAQWTHRALRTEGVVAIWEIEAARKGDEVKDGDGAALYFRLTSTAGAYHGDDYKQWLRQAGFKDVRIKRPKLSPGSVLIIGKAA